MPASPIRKLVPFAECAKQKGIHVYHLNIGQPDIETPTNAIEKIKNTTIKVLEYSHSAGIPSYRQKLVEYYKTCGIDISVDEIIVTTGGSEAILFAMQVCLNPGDEIIIPEPFYANYNGFACNAGVTVKPIQSSIENGFALPPIADFEKVITPKTKAIMICNPNNPTGYLYSKQELESLELLIKKYDLFLFADEVYREFCYDGREHFSVMNLESIEQNVILLDSVSKRYSECGARIGAFISKNKDVMAATMKYAQARLSPPTFGQLVAEESINTPSSYFIKVLDEYTQRRDLVVEFINKIPGCFCPKPSGAFYAVAGLPIDDSDKFCQWLLEDFNFNNETVMLAPATGFYSTAGNGKNQIRISYVLNLGSLKSALTCLEEALKVYPGKN